VDLTITMPGKKAQTLNLEVKDCLNADIFGSQICSSMDNPDNPNQAEITAIGIGNLFLESVVSPPGPQEGTGGIVAVEEPVVLGSGGCLTNWICGDWSECNNGTQTRICEKNRTYCYAPPANKPQEAQNCTMPANETPIIEEEELNKGFFSSITAAVIGAFKKENRPVLFALMIAVVALLIIIWAFSGSQTTSKSKAE
jgi:hypothetical protein